LSGATNILLNRLLVHLDQGLLPENQCGLKKEHGTVDIIFTTIQLQKISTKIYRTIHLVLWTSPRLLTLFAEMAGGNVRQKINFLIWS